MSKLRKLQESRASKLAELRTLQTDGEARALNAEEESRFASLTNEITALDSKIEVEKRAGALLSDQVKKDADVQQTELEDGEKRAAYHSYIARGLESLTPEQRSYMESRAAVSGVSGTVLVPDTMANRIEVALAQSGGMFEAASIITTERGGDFILPTVNDTSRKSTIITEYGQSTKATPTFSSVTMKAYTYRTPIVPISEELLQDSAFDVESVIANLLADSHARALNDDFTNGSGTSKPKGIVTAATACATNAASDAITFADIVNLMKSLDGAYQKNAKFMFNTDTFYALASLVDDNNRPLIPNVFVEGVPPTILGKKFIINDDMPDIGSANASMLYGDFSKYKIRLVKGYNTKRFNETLGEWLSIGLMGYGRADGTLLDAGTHPVYKLVHATAVNND